MTSHCDLHVCKKSPEHSVEDLADYFTSLALKTNADKTGFIVFGKKNQPHLLQNRDQKIEDTAQVKYLGVTIDNELSYQTEVKNLVSKKPKVLNAFNLRDCLPNNLLPVKISSIVISPLQYPAVLLSTDDKNLIITLEKQVSWTVKACYDCSKLESSTDIKLQQKILPVHLLLVYRITCYFFPLITNKKTAFNSLNGPLLPTFDCYKRQRSGKFFHRTVSRSKQYDKSVIQRRIEFLNKLPKNLLFSPCNYPTLKRNLRDFFFKQFFANYKNYNFFVKFHGVKSNFRDFSKTLIIK